MNSGGATKNGRLAKGTLSVYKILRKRRRSCLVGKPWALIGNLGPGNRGPPNLSHGTMEPGPMSGTRTALVTGASRGIGRAIAVELARLDYTVGVNYVSRGDAAAEVVSEIVAEGGKAIALAGDVGDAGHRQELLDRLMSEFGRLDLLVNNAGISSEGRRDLLDATEASWDLVFDTNLKGPFFLAQSAARRMIDQIRRRHDCKRKDHQYFIGFRVCRFDRSGRLLHGQGSHGDHDKSSRGSSGGRRHSRVRDLSRCDRKRHDPSREGEIRYVDR